MGGQVNDYSYMRQAIRAAIERSTDNSTWNGAAIVALGGWAIEANRFPDGVTESPARWERPAKYQYVEHAERGVIYKAARLGLATDGATMYCPWIACTDCARAIVMSGIKEVVTLKSDDNGRWQESVKVGLDILREGGVNVRLMDEKFGLEMLRDGKMKAF